MQLKHSIYLLLALSLCGCDLLPFGRKTISGTFVAQIKNDAFFQLDTLVISAEPSPPKNQFSVTHTGYTRYHKPSVMGEDGPHRRVFQGTFDSDFQKFTSTSGLISLSFDEDFDAVRFGEFLYKRVE